MIKIQRDNRLHYRTSRHSSIGTSFLLATLKVPGLPDAFSQSPCWSITWYPGRIHLSPSGTAPAWPSQFPEPSSQCPMLWAMDLWISKDVPTSVQKIGTCIDCAVCCAVPIACNGDSQRQLPCRSNPRMPNPNYVPPCTGWPASAPSSPQLQTPSITTSGGT
jgi:hypothetical protein